MAGPPRILHAVRRLGTGGLEVGVVNLARALDRLGYSQAILCLEDRGELADRLPSSVPVLACAEGRHPQRLPRRAARYLRGWRPEIIHARNGGAWIDATSAWLMAGRRGRLVFSFHGWSRLDRMPRRQALLFRLLSRMTQALAAVSAEAAAQFAEETGIPAGRFVVLRSGVDTSRFRPSADPRPNGRLVLGSVGRLDPVKAHDVLIDAFDRVLMGGRRDLELRLMGDGPCRPALERLVQQRGLAGRVRLLGTADDIPDQLRQLDLFVLPSRREARPTSIMEAMASGLPVVATRVGSVPAMVAVGRTGLLVNPGDAEGLAEALATLVDDPSLRGRMAIEGRRVALDELSLDRMVEQYDAFYREIARTDPGAPR